jgi:hypothetical protein
MLPVHRPNASAQYRRRLGEGIGERLEFILDAIETLVLPVNPEGGVNCS